MIRNRARELQVYRILAAIFGLLDLTILMRVSLKHRSEYIVGERFVMDELIIPTPIYVFHFKPITLFVIFGFLYWAIGLEAWRNHVLKWPNMVKRGLFIFCCLGAFIMGYEFLQNFLMWTSFFIMYGGNLDMLYHQLNPAMPKPVNFNFISKLFSMFFAGALYGIYYFHRMIKEGERP
ncbi:MAG: hypothetical protein ACP5QI_04080 [Candidatus Bathyarchaeia archaeon]